MSGQEPTYRTGDYVQVEFEGDLVAAPVTRCSITIERVVTRQEVTVELPNGELLSWQEVL